jgi:hypothetical protein
VITLTSTVQESLDQNAALAVTNDIFPGEQCGQWPDFLAWMAAGPGSPDTVTMQEMIDWLQEYPNEEIALYFAHALSWEPIRLNHSDEVQEAYANLCLDSDEGFFRLAVCFPSGLPAPLQAAVDKRTLQATLDAVRLTPRYLALVGEF